MSDDPAGKSEAALRAHQNDRLRETIARVYESTGFYHDRLAEAGVSPSDIDSVAELTALPFTTSSDIRQTDPGELLTVPVDRLGRIHTSSGTSGDPKRFGYSPDDLDVWGRLIARSLRTAGFSATDVVQNAAKLGLVTGGLGWHDGLEELGATVVPSATAGLDRQLALIRDFDVDGLICFPSFALDIADAVARRGEDPGDLPVSTITVGGEPTSGQLRTEIADAFDAVVTEHYGLSELFGAGIATECSSVRDGMYIWEDHFLPEVVDPETGERVPDGEYGELVITSLSKEAMPLLRYRTGDCARILADPCPRGRIHARVDVIDRLTNAISLGATTVYPTAIERELLAVAGTAPYYRIDVRPGPAGDELHITVEQRRTESEDQDVLADRVASRLDETLPVSPHDVSIVDPNTLDRPRGSKATRVYDHREAGRGRS